MKTGGSMRRAIRRCLNFPPYPPGIRYLQAILFGSPACLQKPDRAGAPVFVTLQALRQTDGSSLPAFRFRGDPFEHAVAQYCLL
jgi:hypothetical protein